MDPKQVLELFLGYFPEPWREPIAATVGVIVVLIALISQAKKAGLFAWKTLPPPEQTLPRAQTTAAPQRLSQDQLLDNVASGKIDLETAKWLFEKLPTKLDGSERAQAEAAFVTTVQTIGAAPMPGEKDALNALAEGHAGEALRLLSNNIGPTNPSALQTLTAIAAPSNPQLAVQKFNEFATTTTASRPLDKRERVKLSYSSPLFPGVTIGIVTGNFADIDDADAWVNSENDWLTMARMLERSVSATIRFYAAKREPADAEDEKEQIPLNDPIQKALRPRPYGKVRPLPLGSIRITRAWELSKRNNVKRILHVVSVNAKPLRGSTLGPDPSDYVRDVMRTAEGFNRAFLRGEKAKLRSMVVPLFGTGMAGSKVDELTDFLVEGLLQGVAAISKTKGKKPTLREIRLVAFSTAEFVPLRNSFEKRVKAGDLVEIASDKPQKPSALV